MCCRISRQGGKWEAPSLVEVEGDKGISRSCVVVGMWMRKTRLMIFEGKVAATSALARSGQVKAERIHLLMSDRQLKKIGSTMSTTMALVPKNSGYVYYCSNRALLSIVCIINSSSREFSLLMPPWVFVLLLPVSWSQNIDPEHFPT